MADGGRLMSNAITFAAAWYWGSAEAGTMGRGSLIGKVSVRVSSRRTRAVVGWGEEA